MWNLSAKYTSLLFTMLITVCNKCIKNHHDIRLVVIGYAETFRIVAICDLV